MTCCELQQQLLVSTVAMILLTSGEAFKLLSIYMYRYDISTCIN